MQVTKKLVGLGDSIMKGVLMVQEENGKVCYSLSDQNIVDRVGASMHADVLNLGKMGCTVEAGERVLNRYIEQLREAEYVLLCFGGNDSDYNWREIADNHNQKYSAKTILNVFEKTYTRIVNTIKEAGCSPIILSLPPMNAQKYFDFFTGNFSAEQKKNVLTWLRGSVDTIWAGHELYNDAVKRVAAMTDSLLVDVTTPLGDGAHFLCDDGIHPNQRGQELIAQIIKRNLPCKK